MTSWTLYVFFAATINGLPALVPTIVEGPVQFVSAEACAARGRRYISPQTKVLCVSDDRQVEVGT